MGQSVTEFDIVRVVPHVDLVLFNNVISCYPGDRAITVNYTLGEAVASSGWDWVGIYRSEWRNIDQYLVYDWAPSSSFDCTAPRRRAVSFPAAKHKIPAGDQQQYQFLYISQGSHVIGVSSPFKIVSPEVDPDLCLYSLFREVTSVIYKSSRKSKRSRAKKGRSPTLQICDTYEVIDPVPETSAETSTKKRKRNRRKHAILMSDSEVPEKADKVAPQDKQASRSEGSVTDKVTLAGNRDKHVQLRTNVPCKKRIMEIYRNPNASLDVARIFGPGTSYSPLSLREVVENFVRQQQNPITPEVILGQAIAPSVVLPIEYPSYLSVKAGPQSYLLCMRNTSDPCSLCRVARTLVQDLSDRLSEQEKKNTILCIKMQKMEKVEKIRAQELIKHRSQSRCVATRSQELQVGAPIGASTMVTVACTTEEPLASTLTAGAPENREEGSGWELREQRSTIRMKKIIEKKTREIELLTAALVTKETQITSLQNQASALRLERKVALERADKYQKMTEEVQVRIKDVLAEREDQQKSSWKQNYQDTKKEKSAQTDDQPTTTSSSKRSRFPPRDHVTHKQISKLKSTEMTPPRSRLHKERKQAEQCPTCGLKFSLQADKGVIESHIKYHRRKSS